MRFVKCPRCELNYIPENEEYKLYGIINALLELIRSDLKSLNVPEMRSIRVSAEKSMDYRYNYIRTPKVVTGTITVSYVYNTTNRYKSI